MADEKEMARAREALEKKKDVGYAGEEPPPSAACLRCVRVPASIVGVLRAPKPI